MNASVRIRAAAPGDIPDLIRLLTELVSLESDFDTGPEQMEKGLRLLLSDPESRRIFVAESGGAVAGMCAGQVFPSSAEGGLVLLVEDFVVTESERGRGLGKKLIRAVEAWGREKGAKRFQLLADRDNAEALEFYRRQGWARSGLTYLFKRSKP